MEPVNQNVGTFMQASGGGGDAVMEAIARRQGQLNQNTQQPQTLPSAPPQGSAAPSAPPQSANIAMGGAPVPGAPVGSNEADLILRALSDRLKSSSRINETQAGVIK